MSHYIPSTEKYPIVYYVNLFYKFFIPAVLGPMLILVVMDFGRLMINRFRKPKSVEAEAPVAEPEAEVVAETKPLDEPEIPEPVEEPETPGEVSPADEPVLFEEQETTVDADVADESDVSESSNKPDIPEESKPLDDEESSNG